MMRRFVLLIALLVVPGNSEANSYCVSDDICSVGPGGGGDVTLNGVQTLTNKTLDGGLVAGSAPSTNTIRLRRDATDCSINVTAAALLVAGDLCQDADDGQLWQCLSPALASESGGGANTTYCDDKDEFVPIGFGGSVTRLTSTTLGGITFASGAFLDFTSPTGGLTMRVNPAGPETGVAYLKFIGDTETGQSLSFIVDTARTAAGGPYTFLFDKDLDTFAEWNAVVGLVPGAADGLHYLTDQGTYTVPAGGATLGAVDTVQLSDGAGAHKAGPDLATIVQTTGAQTIGGDKTFSNNVTVGGALTVTCDPGLEACEDLRPVEDTFSPGPPAATNVKVRYTDTGIVLRNSAGDDFPFSGSMEDTLDFREDFCGSGLNTGSVGTNGWAVVNAFGGFFQYANNGEFGPGRSCAIALRSSTDPTGQIALFTSGAVSPMNFNLAAGSVYRASAALSVISSADPGYTALLGFCNSSTATVTCTNGVYFKYDVGTSPNWQYCVVSVTGGAPICATSTVPVTFGNIAGYKRFKIVMPDGGSSAAFYIDGSLVGTHASGRPIATDEGVGLSFHLLKNAGAVEVMMYLDYAQFTQQFATPR